MRTTSETRQRLLAGLAVRVGMLPADRTVIVAIDGVDGAGKTVFADELGDLLRSGGRPVIRSGVDGFHRPRAERYRLGRASPEGYYRDSYDYRRLTEYLLDPLGPTGSGLYRSAAFDHETDARVWVPYVRVERRSVLILDGIFLHRPELRDRWDFSIFLAVGFDVSVRRCAERDGAPPDPHAPENRRYVEGQHVYLREAQPWRHATVIIDNTDLAAPQIIQDRFGVTIAALHSEWAPGGPC